MSLWDWLRRWTPDNRDRNEPEQDAQRKISPAMPMAGAGAELSAENEDSETEAALKRASTNDRETDAA